MRRFLLRRTSKCPGGGSGTRALSKRSAARVAALLLVLAVGGSCAGPARQETGILQRPRPPVGGGKQRETLVLLTPEGISLRLDGALTSELAQVEGARVRLEGRYRRGRLEVEEYLLLDVGDGVSPHVGLLRWELGRLLLIQAGAQPPLELTGDAVLHLRAHVGARVWVIGPVIGPERLQVLRTGILRPAQAIP